jgi:hypothetical protein
LIADTEGNVFGGFTPVEWESGRYGKCKGDDSLRSFLFTLRNPHGVPPQWFAPRAEKKQDAIICSSDCGRVFYGCLFVYDNCNANRDSFTQIGTRYNGRVYANGTDLEHCLTGADKFTVKEIEVFEIAD